MRPQLFVTLLMILFHINLHAQVDYMKTYHPIIVQAESEILDSNYSAALSSYQKVFQLVPRSFAKDFHNAAICAIETQQLDIAFQYLDSLITKGVKKSFFETGIPFESLRKHAKWQKWIQTFDSKYQKWNQDKDIQLRKMLGGLEFNDQEFRSARGSYQVYRDTINQIDKVNVRFLREIIKNKGFPGENLIGINNPVLDEQPADIVFLHQFQKMSKGIGDFDFTEIMLEAVKNGRLDPHKAAYWLSMQSKPIFDFGGTGILILVYKNTTTDYRVYKYDAAKKLQINERRKIFGLDPLEAMYQKAILKFDTKMIQKFSFANFQLSEFFMSSESSFNNLLNSTELVRASPK